MSSRKPPRWKRTTWHGLDQYVCTAPGCPFDTLDRGKMVRHAQAKHPRAWEAGVEEDATPLAGVPFASTEAEGLAYDAQLTADSFDFTPSGKTGFTTADVRHAAKALTEED